MPTKQKTYMERYEDAQKFIREMGEGDKAKLRDAARKQGSIDLFGTGEGLGSSDVYCKMVSLVMMYDGMPPQDAIDIIENDYQWCRDQEAFR